VKSFNDTLEESVSKAIDNKVKESGGINAAILDEQIRQLEGTLLARLDQLSVGAGDGLNHMLLWRMWRHLRFPLCQR